jgi:PD-(D/E)XK nuclease superfamily
LAWILEELQKPPGSAADVLEVLGIAEPAIVAISQSRNFKIEREFYIRAVGRLDLLLTLDKSVMVIIEVKKYSAETADTAKQAGYYQWLEEQGFRQQRAFLLVPDAAEEKYENFSRLLWADVCIRLRRVLPNLVTRIGPVRSAMLVAFISAVETNLLGLMAPARDTDAVERLSYAGTVEYLEKYLGGSAL